MVTSGSAHAITAPKLRLRDNMHIMPPAKSINVLIKPRILIWIKFCNCVISLVTLVISEPVENLSVCSKEKDIIFLNISFLKSLPKFCDAILAHTPHKMPDNPPRITNIIILSPSVSTRFRLPTPLLDKPKTPSSTMVLIKRG